MAEVQDGIGPVDRSPVADRETAEAGRTEAAADSGHNSETDDRRVDEDPGVEDHSLLAAGHSCRLEGRNSLLAAGRSDPGEDRSDPGGEDHSCSCLAEASHNCPEGDLEARCHNSHNHNRVSGPGLVGIRLLRRDAAGPRNDLVRGTLTWWCMFCVLWVMEFV